MAQLTNVPPAQTALRLERRRSFSLGVNIALDDDTYANLTDHALTFVMAQPAWKGGAVVITEALTLPNPTGGEALLVLQATDLDIVAGEYPYAITMLTDEGYSLTLVKGDATVEDNTDPATAGVYAGGAAAQTITLTLQQNNTLTVKLATTSPPDISIAAVEQLEYWEAPRAYFTGSYPHLILHLALPGPGNLGGTAPSVDNVPPGSVLAVIWDGADWKIGDTVVTVRPTARTDIVIHLIDPIGTATVPGWALLNDLFDQLVA